jgi:hypothetical protein
VDAGALANIGAAAVAAYAAILSTYVYIQQSRKDRLRVAVRFSWIPGELRVQIVNNSNRPVYLDTIGVIVKSRGAYMSVLPIDSADVISGRPIPPLEAGQPIERRLKADTLRAYVAEGRRWIYVTSLAGLYHYEQIPDDVINAVLGK